ncbi:hypothetical protein E2542_SST21966 [Spatholobus suberectus]|nr:hypothetical protein E2542_SST21966 [Spatholobus suberectus]
MLIGLGRNSGNVENRGAYVICCGVMEIAFMALDGRIEVENIKMVRRARGRREVQTNPQIYGMPTPPPDAATANTFPSPPPPHSHSKPDNTHNV